MSVIRSFESTCYEWDYDFKVGVGFMKGWNLRFAECNLQYHREKVENFYYIDSKCKYLSYERSKCHFVPLNTPSGRDVQCLKYGGSYIQVRICITPEENLGTKIKTARSVM